MRCCWEGVLCWPVVRVEKCVFPTLILEMSPSHRKRRARRQSGLSEETLQIAEERKKRSKKQGRYTIECRVPEKSKEK